MKKQRTVLIVGGLVLLVGAASLRAYLRRQRKDPSACPYGLRFSLDLPHPFVTHPRLREMLSPEPGQRVLEVGPGTGYYALQAARWLEPGGTLDILDIQQEMLDHTMHRARAMGVSNIVPRRGDAQALPYPDDHFDSAYLVATLGEVPDKGRALRELRKSGLLRETVLEVALYDPNSRESVVFSAWGEKANWYRNLEATPAYEVRSGCQRYAAELRFLTPEDKGVGA
jgi:protein-L-isoaspartate O-methyltransferase